MKLKAKEQSFLFSNTTIPDVFFAEYLSSASGDFVKVYLYILYLSKYNKDIDSLLAEKEKELMTV